MRVLHMPVNTSSIASTTVRKLRQLGVNANGIMFATNIVQSFDGLNAIYMGNKRHPHHALLGILRFAYALSHYLRAGKPDIVHWYYSGSATTLDMDIRLLKALKVPGVIEWTGSDIRIPEIEFRENPYYAAVFHHGYEYAEFESLSASRHRQKRFTEIGCQSIAATGMVQYIQPDIVPITHRVEQRLNLSEYEPRYPNKNNPMPLIVHSPTAKITKGTGAVLTAIDKLSKSLNFNFRLISGIPRHEALQLVQKADIFLDQFVLGDRGLAALEAMAYGKPVICYIKPSLVKAYPSECPIINATQEQLTDVLASLIQKPNQRHEIGRQSRAFMENYHDADKVVSQLISVYQKVITVPI